ncbi:MarR family transcriptional regulator [Sphingomonas sp. T9W2]|uniref:MarR family winged helix-turn-helix transcriptional regulator n=1 Tax=Sphingomonas sp. T9W2 TaxID=3143183 RepID=UPI0031F554BD
MSEAVPHTRTLGQLVGYRLRRASAVFAADFAVTLEGTGIRQIPMGILSVVADNPGINQGTVGRLLGIKRANMVPLINELIESGLIVRETDPADRRAFTLAMSPAGSAMFDDCIRRIEAHEERLLAGFTKAEKAVLLDLLERIEQRAVAVD